MPIPSRVASRPPSGLSRTPAPVIPGVWRSVARERERELARRGIERALAGGGLHGAQLDEEPIGLGAQGPQPGVAVADRAPVPERERERHIHPGHELVALATGLGDGHGRELAE